MGVPPGQQKTRLLVVAAICGVGLVLTEIIAVLHLAPALIYWGDRFFNPS